MTPMGVATIFFLTTSALSVRMLMTVMLHIAPFQSVVKFLA